MAWKPGSGEEIKEKNGKRGRRRESVLATGSFDASAGIWRRAAGAGDVENSGNDQDADENEHGKSDHHDGDAMETDLTHGSGPDQDDDDSGWSFSVILDGHDSEIKSLSWSAGGQFLATCSRDKSVWIWEELDDDNFETAAVLAEHDGDVKCVAWHPTEELLASASYDDTIRLYKEDFDDWACVSVLDSHENTVWCVDWEPVENPSPAPAEERADGSDHSNTLDQTPSRQAQQAFLSDRASTGPRLISCSADLTIRVWRRQHKPAASNTPRGNHMPSILRTSSVDEEWLEEAQLPQRHERAIYAVAWSKRTGRVVSAGSDGKIVVYHERWKPVAAASSDPQETNGTTSGPSLSNGDTDRAVHAKDEMAVDHEPSSQQSVSTCWEVLAELEAAHGVFEINHVCWSQRWDSGRERDDEEMIVSTGDDGEVKTWILGKSSA